VCIVIIFLLEWAAWMLAAIVQARTGERESKTGRGAAGV
jgi:hypothetical protein